MKCSYCGTINNDENNYCKLCGTKLEKADVTTKKEDTFDLNKSEINEEIFDLEENNENLKETNNYDNNPNKSLKEKFKDLNFVKEENIKDIEESKSKLPERKNLNKVLNKVWFVGATIVFIALGFIYVTNVNEILENSKTGEISYTNNELNELLKSLEELDNSAETDNKKSEDTTNDDYNFDWENTFYGNGYTFKYDDSWEYATKETMDGYYFGGIKRVSDDSSFMENGASKLSDTRLDIDNKKDRKTLYDKFYTSFAAQPKESTIKLTGNG